MIVVLACVLGLSGADTATVGASATELRHALHINNTDIGLLVAVSALVGALASLPFGILADRGRRTRILAGAICFWSFAMVFSAAVTSFDQLLLARVLLGVVTAAAGPLVASLVGDYFPAAERGRIYGIILTGELAGAGFGFAVTGDIATLSWRAAFVLLALPALALAWLVFRLDEPTRGGSGSLRDERRRAQRHGRHSVPIDVQRLAQEHGLTPDERVLARGGSSRKGMLSAMRYVIHVRTNVILIAASAAGYYFIAGIQTFGIEFAKQQYHIDQAFANLVLLIAGAGAMLGVLAGGAIGDELVRRRYLNGRILTSAVTATAATLLFAPAIIVHSALGALPYLGAAAFALSAQNPAIDAARLDIIPSALWGRAEAIRTLLRSLAQALAPLLFGAVSDYVFGGGRSGLQWTFAVMLLPLAASATLLYRALDTYPGDVVTAAAVSRRWQSSCSRGRHQRADG